MSLIQTNLKENSQEKILKIKAFIEEMELQLALGKADALEELKNQKKMLNSFIIEQKKIINNITIADKKDVLKILFEELQLQLALGKAETADFINKNRELIIQKIKSIEEYINKNINALSHEQETFFQSFGFKTDKLKYLLEITRLEFALGKADLIDEIEKDKKEFLNKLHNFKFQLEHNIENIEFKIDKASHEIKKDFNAFLSGLQGK